MMAFYCNNYLVTTIIICLLLLGCGSPGLDEGKDSLIGSWEVYEVFYAEGIRTDLGTHTDTSYTRTGTLGNFIFTEDAVIYNYSYAMESIMDQSSWDLIRSTVNCGFNQCEVYTLELKDVDLSCTFGDDTADAEKNAEEITLTFETIESGPYLHYTLSLRK